MFETLTIRDIISILLKRLWLIIWASVAGAIVAYLFSSYVIPEQYSSKATLYVYNKSNEQSSSPSMVDINLATRLVNTYIVILKSDTVLTAVSEKIAEQGLYYTPAQIRNMIKANAVNNTEVFEVTVTNHLPGDAQIIAAAIAETAPPEIIRVVKAGSVEVIDPPQYPTIPTAPDVRLFTFIGLILGMAVSSILSFLIEFFDTSIRNEEELISKYDAPVLGIIPSMGE